MSTKTCTNKSPTKICHAPAALAVRTTSNDAQGLKTLIYWDHTDAPKTAQVLCAEHGVALITDLAKTLARA